MHRWWMDFRAELAPGIVGSDEQHSEHGLRIRQEQGVTQPERRRHFMHYSLLAPLLACLQLPTTRLGQGAHCRADTPHMS